MAQATADDDDLPHIEVGSAQGSVVGDHITQTNIFYTGPGRAQSVYREVVLSIAPPELNGRDQELQQLNEFCHGDERYAWWKGGAWSGKTALMSWFVLHPPEDVDVVSFFITARIAGQADSTAFVEALIDQLAALVGDSTPVTPSTLRAAHLLSLIRRASEQTADRGRRLVIVVDELDAEAAPQSSSDLPSIPALLPADPSHHVRVIVSSRTNFDLPSDVSSVHPLRTCSIFQLAPSPVAADIRRRAFQELDLLLDGPPEERNLLGFMAAAGGGLSANDLSSLTQSLTPNEVRQRLGKSADRTINIRRGRYFFAHEAVHNAAKEGLRDQLDDYRTRIYEWVGDYAARGWPTSTPQYMLDGYPQMLRAVGDTARLKTLTRDRAWHAWMQRCKAGEAILAGLDSDEASVEDLIGVWSDVRMLATLAAATRTHPPLAIALIGDWGSGKSSVMRQMRDQVAEIARLSSQSSEAMEFARVVRQIEFNAWHYSDDQVWTGLIEHLFRELASPSGIIGPVVPDTAKVTALNHERTHLIQRLDRLRNQRRQRPAANGLLEDLGSPTDIVPIARVGLHEFLLDARNSWRLLLGWLLVAIAAVVVQAVAGRFAVPVAAVGALLAPVVTLGGYLRKVHGTIKEKGGQLEKAFAAKERRLGQSLARVTARLAEIDAALRLSQFLEHQSSNEPYASHRGLVGQVHRALRTLQDDLDSARDQWERNQVGSPPLERIVLYIDDLDRCPPDRVVDVLAAVHLLLALRLFVVVVAVDSRWLLRSLEHQYPEMLEALEPEKSEKQRSATALDYLDKIFQIPFAVRALSTESAGTFIANLTAEAGRSEPQSTTGTPSSLATALDEQIAVTEPTGQPQASEDGPREPANTPAAPQSPVFREPTGGAASPPDLRPRILRIEEPEREFLSSLGPLITTPRAAKKLVNLYRLIRIGIGEERLADFVANRRYMHVQLLLALLVGYPASAPRILNAMRDAPAETSLPLVLRNLTKSAASPGLGNAVDAMLAVIQNLSQEPEITHFATLALLQPWCDEVARFSFYTATTGESRQSPEQ